MSSSKGKVVAILLGSMVFATVVIYGVFSLFIQLSERELRVRNTPGMIASIRKHHCALRWHGFSGGSQTVRDI